MSDIFFIPDKVPTNALARAQRGAVLTRLLSRRNQTLSIRDKAQVIAAVNRVLAIWRKRLTRLRRSGWTVLDGVRDQGTRNCEPAIVCMKPSIHGHRSYSCSQTMICPWCWSRMVMGQIYERIEGAFTSLGCPYDPAREEYPYKLSVKTTKFNIPIDGEVGVMTAYAYAEAVYRDVVRRWKGHAYGLISNSTFQPGKKGFDIRTSVIAMVDKDKPLTSKPIFLSPSPKNLGRAVAYACPYPVGMMYGDAEKAILLMEMRQKKRFFRPTGCFRLSEMSSEEGEEVLTS